jgi:hypothetical protein
MVLARATLSTITPTAMVLRRPLLYLFERALRDHPQVGQGSVALHRVPFQYLCNVFSAFMITTVGKEAAGFFQYKFHIDDGTLIQFTHCATSLGACRKTSSFASNSQVL